MQSVKLFECNNSNKWLRGWEGRAAFPIEVRAKASSRLSYSQVLRVVLQRSWNFPASPNHSRELLWQDSTPGKGWHPTAFSWRPSWADIRHAEWHGWTLTDTVFPFFLWIVGVAMTLSAARRLERGDSRALLFGHAVRRALIIFGLGLFLALYPYFHVATVRIPGVLQRIVVCYLIATVIYLITGIRGQIAWTGGLLAANWILMKCVPVPGVGAGVLTKEGNFSHWVPFLPGSCTGATGL